MTGPVDCAYLAEALAALAADERDRAAKRDMADASEAIRALAAEVEALREERDRWKTHHDTQVRRKRDVHSRHIHSLREARRLRASLEEVAYWVLVMWANGAEEADAVTTLNTIAPIIERALRHGEPKP